MPADPRSNVVHWEFSNTTANTAKIPAVYDQTGTEITSHTGKTYYLTHITAIVGNTGMRVDVFADAAAGGTVTAGERILSGVYTANSGESKDLSATPRRVGVGENTLTILTSAAAQVDLVGHGYYE